MHCKLGKWVHKLLMFNRANTGMSAICDPELSFTISSKLTKALVDESNQIKSNPNDKMFQTLVSNPPIRVDEEADTSHQ